MKIDEVIRKVGSYSVNILKYISKLLKYMSIGGFADYPSQTVEML